MRKKLPMEPLKLVSHPGAGLLLPRHLLDKLLTIIIQFVQPLLLKNLPTLPNCLFGGPLSYLLGGGA